ncbi:MAG: cupin domain-containing protein [Phycisphaerae bacterium]|nr:cupin domain-containing protein [Phycisphaerae bacterium]
MKIDYTSLLGYEQGARKIHVHLTNLDTRGPGGNHQHSHKAEEAVYFIEGEAEYTFGGKAHKVGPGDLLFFPSGVEHAEVKYFTDAMKYLVIRSVEGDADERCCCGKDRPPA